MGTAADSRETIGAIATPPGRGAVAIVRISGPDVRAVAERLLRISVPAPRQAVRCTVVDAAGAPIDDGLALFFPGPASYTGEDVLELQVHGSPVVARDVLGAALAAGVRLAGPGEFTRRAFLAGKLDLSAAEAVGDLIAAEHRSAARAALAHLEGGLARAVADARGELAAVLDDLAAALDFPDEVVPPSAARLDARLGAVRATLDELAATAEHGRLVREGVGVAIVGPPNAGKSSLLNALLGADRVLVSAVPGTTRDTIEETLALGPLVARIVDTAGLREAADPLEAAGIRRAEAALAAARIALVVVDGSAPSDDAVRALLARTRERPRVVLFTKRDLGTAGYDAREPAERAALCGSTFAPETAAAVRAALLACAVGDDAPDLERPHLANARQRDAVFAARRALDEAAATLARDEPIDLLAGDLLAADAALGALSGADATEALLDRIFARFCIGK